MASDYSRSATSEFTNEPASSYRFTNNVLGRDMCIEQGGTVQEYYSGRGTRSTELGAALEIAISVFARKITEIHAEPFEVKRIASMREFGLLSPLLYVQSRTKHQAQDKLFVSEEVSIYLQNPENRARLRERFPDANLTDELIESLLPASTPAPQPHPSAG